MNMIESKVLMEDETLRDGLQMESRIFSLVEKLAIFDQLQNAGVRRIQVGSFVNPKRVPQMADTEELIRAIRTRGATALLSALILNERGLERALDCSLEHVSMSISVSDTHSRKNTGKPQSEALTEMAKLIRKATGSGLAVRAGLQCSFGCAYEGTISTDLVLSSAEMLAGAGATEVNLADTTGMATPLSINSLVNQIQAELPDLAIFLHLHDTKGLGLANMFAGYGAGVRTFDTSAGGLGGCPFVPGAAGNVPTEDAVNMFALMGIDTGIDLKRLCVMVASLEKILGRKLPGRMKTVFGVEKTDATNCQ